MGNHDSADTKTFEIGLVLAGTVSAGAYSAGVMDFLIEALDAWELAKSNSEGPPHDAKLKVMAGSSGGALCGSIAAVSLFSRGKPFRHDAPPPEPKENRFYDAWVRRIDIRHLLSQRDLNKDEDAKAKSLLDSTEITEIAGEVLQVERRDQPRSYLADPLHIYNAVTNVRGVDYHLHLRGGKAGRTTGLGHPMRAHADYLHFVASETRPQGALDDDRPSPEPLWLNPGRLGQGRNWNLLAQSALASAAFPVGLEARNLDRLRLDYKTRLWPIPQETKPDDELCNCIEGRPIEPAWPDPDPLGYRFVNVDAGTVNNEPFELARRELAGIDGRNPRDPFDASRAVILIDPLLRQKAISEKDYDPNKRNDIVSVAKELVSIFINQSRFKADELALAEDEATFSRFLIAPKRAASDDPQERRYYDYPIFGEVAGAFAAFLQEVFRRHDFLLGRRNCQHFLRRHFVLPEEHKLFKAWDEAAKAHHCAKDENGDPIMWPVQDDDDDEDDDIDEDGDPTVEPQRLLPIVPLVGPAAETEPLPARPGLEGVRIDQVARHVADRVVAVAERVIDTDLKDTFNGITRWLLKLALRWVGKGKIADFAEKKLEEELQKLKDIV